MRHYLSGILVFAATLFAIAFFVSAPAIAQDSEAEEKGRLVRFVEEQISSPNMQISLNGLAGALSSDVSLSSITIADENGIWLTLTNPRLVWNRSALLRGRLEVESLTAAELEVTRTPAADESLPDAEASGFSIPELPVAVQVQQLQLDRAFFGEAVFGLEATLSLNGRFALADGNLDTELAIERLDGPGGSLGLLAKYNAAEAELETDITLSEPAGGVLANLLSIHEQPAIALSISGGGPVEDLQLNLGLDADNARVLDGRLELDDGFLSSDIGGNFELEGALSTLLAPDQRAFFGDNSRIAAQFEVPSDGGFVVEQLTLDSGAMSANGRIIRQADGFISLVDLTANLALPDGMPVVLPGQAPSPSLSDAALTLQFDAAQSDRWTTQLQVRDLRTQQAIIPALTLNGGGVVSAADANAGRTVTFDVDASAQGIDAAEAELQDALGDAITASLAGRWASSGRTALQLLRVTGDTFNIEGEGGIENLTFDGRVVANADNLQRFAAITDRPLQGAAQLVLDGTVQLVGGGFDLETDGRLQNFQMGIDQLDGLLASTTRLAGGAKRDENGLAFDQLVLTSPQARIEIDGTYASTSADLSGLIQVDDLSNLDDRADGQLRVTLGLDQAEPVGAEGEEQVVQPLAITARAAVSDATLLGRPVPSLMIDLDAAREGEVITGDLTGDGKVNGSPFDLSSAFTYRGLSTALEGLRLSLGPTQISGDLDYVSGLLDGSLDVRSTDISDLLALALQTGAGAVQADLDFSYRLVVGETSLQDIAFDASVSGFRFQDYRIGTAKAVGDVQDAFGTPQISADISARDAAGAGVIVNELDAVATTAGQIVSIDASARLNGSTNIETEAQITPRDDGVGALIETLAIRSPFGDTSLLSAAQIDLAGGVTRLADVNLSIGRSGRLSISGSAGDTLNLSGSLSSVPLEIANAFSPGLGLGGTLSGQFDIGGTPASPQATFGLDANAVGANALREAGVGTLNASAAGRFAGQTVTLTSASVQDGAGLTADASGSIPLSGAGLRVDVRAQAPLALANRFLADRGARVSGSGSVTATVTGSLAATNVNGLVSINGGTFIDPLSNLRLDSLNVLASLQGNRVSINRAGGNLAGGGQVSLSGSVGLTDGLPADLSINLSQAQYTDGEIFTVQLGARLAVTGSLATSPVISGQVDIAEANITIPNSLGGAGELLPVVHVNPGQPTLRTLARIKQVTPDDGGGGSAGGGPRLDVVVNAPNRIFLRGRGVDSELGGSVRIRGALNNLAPVGAFNLIRGRLSILSKRINLTEGSVRLTGTLDPRINLLAQVQEADVTAFIRLFGRASNLELELSSSPELPDDEILAQILFGEGIGSLSPLQIASLASAAASLTTGGSGPGLADQIRQGLGVDDLDVVTDSEGNTAVRAGKYLRDNVYLETEAGANGGEVSINLDITDSLKAKGSVGSDGDSKLGIFFEKDY